MQALNGEMLAEAVDMEALLAQRKQINVVIMAQQQHACSTSADTGTGTDKDKDKEKEFHSGLGPDLGPGLSTSEKEDEIENRRVELAAVESQILMCEGNIDRITRELDVYNAGMYISLYLFISISLYCWKLISRAVVH